MINKIKAIWGSVRFRAIVLGGISLWLNDVVANGFDWSAVLKMVAGILLATAGVGTVDKLSAKPTEVINE
jgi:hypothetical protein